MLLLTYNHKTDLEEDEDIKAEGGALKGAGEASKRKGVDEGEESAGRGVDEGEESERWFLLYVHRALLEGTALLDCVFVCVFGCVFVVSTV